ncbi:MAG: ATP-binding cassette domain-containing protein [Thermoanaerobaculia bacterium]|nr:MAG: ATP-binding cassette domain-containing protein [Thermoanaerobaculia bacterium]MBZ0103229.1 ABC transporter ATP-binding protein [Thermoanaerobaculia bacterium]
MIEAFELTRRFGEFTAVDGVSFTIPDGEIVGLLGPNGAGKTTIIRMITGFLPPTSGRVTLGGRDLFGDDVSVRRQLGYLPENVALYPEMRVEEYLAWRGRLAGMERAAIRRRLPEVLDGCLLGGVRRQVIGTLSKGYRQRVGLAGAILHEPRVLVLDEPTVGLDPRQIVAIRELIRELGRDRTLLLSTHILPEVDLLCRRVMIVDRGRIVAEGSPAELRERGQGSVAIRVELESEVAGAAAALASVPGVEQVRAEDGDPRRFVLACARGADPRAEVFRLAAASGWTLVGLAASRASLEDVFVRLTTRDEEGGNAAAREVA